jgi:DNA polymerase-3 subunit gamma/tau
MVVNCAGLDKQNLSVTGSQRDVLKQQADRLTADTILAGLDVLVSAKNRMRFTSHGRVLFEMALVRLCRLEALVPLAQLAQWVARDAAAPTIPGRPQSGPTETLAGPALGSTAAAAPGEKKKPPTDLAAAVAIALTKESLDDIWRQVLSEVGFILASALRKVSDVAIFGPNTLVLRIPQAYNPLGDQYLDGNRLSKVEEVLTRIVGEPCTLRLEIAGPEIDGHGPPREKAASAMTGTAKKQRQRSEIAQLPLVGKAMDVLGGQIVHMDDDFGAEASGPLVPEPSNPGEEG